MEAEETPLRKNDLLALREIVRSWSVIKYKSKEEDECVLKELINPSDSDSETDSEDELYMSELFALQKSNDSRLSKPFKGSSYYQTVRNYSEHEFSLRFRMKRSTFEALLTKLMPILPYTRTEPMRAVLFAIYMLAQGENFRSGASKFGLSMTTGHRIFKAVCAAIVTLSAQYIKWPSPNEARSIATRFEGICGIPGIVGVTDCWHVSIKQPFADHNAFFNRKLFFSVLLQGTCDDRMQFIDIKVGDPGKTHEATVFLKSPLGKTIETSPLTLLNRHQHLIGNNFHPNSDFMVTPFKDNGRLTSQETSFNDKLKTARGRTKNVFAQLKAKFRRLNYLDISEMDVIIDVIVACCILHNFIIMEKDDSHPIDTSNDVDSKDESEGECPENIQSLYRNKCLKRQKLLSDFEEESPKRKRRKHQ